jgi:hypothetical protein
MSYHVRRTGRVQHKAKPRRQSLQKHNGVIGVDSAKYRSEGMMADYFGRLSTRLIAATLAAVGWG